MKKQQDKMRESIYDMMNWGEGYGNLESCNAYKDLEVFVLLDMFMVN